MNKHTTEEINNQFTTWLKINDVIESSKVIIEETKRYIDENTTIIFTGAGTSGYIGDTLIPHLNYGEAKILFLSIYSTDIVGNPDIWLKNKKVLLVSFARSGNSPESVEAVIVADKFAKECKHLIITCNKDGRLATSFPNSSIILPSETNDSGFAMTNSFSTMMLTAASIFGLKLDFSKLSRNAKELYDSFDYEKFINLEFENIVFLSNTENVGLLTELKLKFMELTSGSYGYYSDQFMNFRHGPKSVLSKKSVIIMIGSTDKITKKYEDDLINEFVNDENKPIIVFLGDADVTADWKYAINGNEFERIISIIPMIQQAAVRLSMKIGNDPDNPCPSGSVNRVVQGVNIHERIK